MYASMADVHDALAEAFGCHDLYALVEWRRFYQQTISVHAKLRSGYTHGTMKHTAQAVTCLCTYYVLRVLEAPALVRIFWGALSVCHYCPFSAFLLWVVT